MPIRVIHLELDEANDLVARLHRHHKPVQGHRFSIGAYNKTGVVGAAIVGRPVARKCDQRNTIEVTRLVTDGTKNTCSILYAAAARAGQELGYRKIQTYILSTESGVSLKAAGWTCEDANCGGGHWVRADGSPRRTDQPIITKQRWVKYLNQILPPNWKPRRVNATDHGQESTQGTTHGTGAN